MDIDLLSKMVKELILDDDKVILPGLGCFVAEVIPASFSDKGFTINPPYRRLYFRSRPDDGSALVDFYAQSNNLEMEVAEKIIRDFLSELKSLLHVRKVVVFPGLGRLRATKENNLFFVADEDLDIYPEGFGLESVSLKTHKETDQEVKSAVADLKNILEINPEPNPEPEAMPEHEQGLKTELGLQPELVSEPELVPELVEVAEEVEHIVKQGRSFVRTILKVMLTLLIILLVLAVIYVVAGHLFPEWIDQFLYSPEELEILRR